MLAGLGMSLMSGAASQLGSGLANQGLKMLGLDGAKDQIKQQEKLMEMQEKHQKNVMAYGKELDKDMYNFTYDKEKAAAQVKNLKEAGLNVGLAYGSGANSTGGTTTTSSGSISGAQAANEAEMIGAQNQMIGMALQNRMTESTINLNEAQANKLNAEAEKTKGIDTEVGQNNLEKIIQETANEKLKGELMGIQKNINNLDIEKVKEDIIYLRRNNEIGEETKAETINTIKNSAIGAVLDNSLKRANIEVNMQQANSIAESIEQKWEEIKIQWKNANSNERNALTNKAAQELMESRPTLQQLGGQVTKNIVNKLFDITDNIGDVLGNENESTKLK